MTTVRQLTTRFSFETDRSGIRRFNKSLASMKKSVIGLAAAFGVTKVVKSLIRMGTNLEKSVVNAKRFSKEVFFLKNNVVRLTGDMARSFGLVEKSIPGRVLISDFLEGFSDFKLFFGKNAPLSNFNKLFIASGRIAKISGRGVNEVFRELSEAARSGDLQVLQKVLAGVDINDVALNNFVKQLQAVDPTGVATIQQRIDGFFRVLKANEKELDAFSRSVVFGTFGGQINEFKLNLRDMGEVIGAKLTRPMIDALNATNKFFAEWSKSGFTWKGLVKTMETRSKTFGAALRGLGKAASFLERVLKGIFKRAKEGFALIETEINKRGLKGFLQFAATKIGNDLNNQINKIMESLGLREKGGSRIDRMMRLDVETQRRVDLINKGLGGGFQAKATLGRPGEITINNTVVIAAGGVALDKKLEDAIANGLRKGVDQARRAFRPPERPRPLKGRGDLVPQ